jgi:hypothetical protein
VPRAVWPATARLTLRSVLRGSGTARRPVALHLLDGGRHEGVPVRVGADFVEITARGECRLVAFAALAASSTER